MFSNKSFCKLILVENNELVGFISIFPEDCEEEKELTPWYATMYVKKEYRNHGYSRILNDAILKEAKYRGFLTLYLKTDLKNYYEKFGWEYLCPLDKGDGIKRAIYIFKIFDFGSLAQSVEHLTFNQRVWSSNLQRGTTLNTKAL